MEHAHNNRYFPFWIEAGKAYLTTEQLRGLNPTQALPLQPYLPDPNCYFLSDYRGRHWACIQKFQPPGNPFDKFLILQCLH